MKFEQEPYPFIRLNKEGTLLECHKTFICQSAKKGRGSSSRIWRDLDWEYPNIRVGDHVLFLGCRHFAVKPNIGSLQTPPKLKKRFLENRIFLREYLREELFKQRYYTSLHFLWKEEIVKVSWSGKSGLDQLSEASHFMYWHLRVPYSLLRKERE